MLSSSLTNFYYEIKVILCYGHQAAVIDHWQVDCLDNLHFLEMYVLFTSTNSMISYSHEVRLMMSSRSLHFIRLEQVSTAAVWIYLYRVLVHSIKITQSGCEIL
ncbi:uncharacterized protein [Watersipora subatra]|uniref:uncharacterized protein n=1 Tax=Watersipora subatra TaxID=2589382 RepID=UPI00355BEB63